MQKQLNTSSQLVNLVLYQAAKNLGEPHTTFMGSAQYEAFGQIADCLAFGPEFSQAIHQHLLLDLLDLLKNRWGQTLSYLKTAVTFDDFPGWEVLQPITLETDTGTWYTLARSPWSALAALRFLSAASDGQLSGFPDMTTPEERDVWSEHLKFCLIVLQNPESPEPTIGIKFLDADYDDLLSKPQQWIYVPESHEIPLVVVLGEIPGICHVCHCTQHHPCEGGCSWVESNLCSRCAGNASTQTNP